LASWGEIELIAPDLAHHARALLDAHVHKTLASGSIDPPDWEGDAKVAGVVDDIEDPVRKREIFDAMGADPEQIGLDSKLYRCEVREVAVTRLTKAKDEMAIDFWSEAGGVRSLTRK
jgi:hypothetical protein